jgi:hypothetical protein
MERERERKGEMREENERGFLPAADSCRILKTCNSLDPRSTGGCDGLYGRTGNVRENVSPISSRKENRERERGKWTSRQLMNACLHDVM